MSAIVAVTGSTTPKILLYKDCVTTALVGVIFLGSCLLARQPIVFYMAQRYATDGTHEGTANFDLMWDTYEEFRKGSSPGAVRGVLRPMQCTPTPRDHLWQELRDAVPLWTACEGHHCVFAQPTDTTTTWAGWGSGVRSRGVTPLATALTLPLRQGVGWRHEVAMLRIGELTEWSTHIAATAVALDRGADRRRRRAVAISLPGGPTSPPQPARREPGATALRGDLEPTAHARRERRRVLELIVRKPGAPWSG